MRPKPLLILYYLFVKVRNGKQMVVHDGYEWRRIVWEDSAARRRRQRVSRPMFREARARPIDAINCVVWQNFRKKGEQTLFLQATSYLCNSGGAIFLLVLFSGRPVNAICNVSEAAEWYRPEELEICGRMGYVIIAANLNGRVCWRLKLNP